MKTPTVLQAVDPSICSLGVASFLDERLVASEHLAFKTQGLDMIERVKACGDAVENYCRLHDAWPDVLVVEWPQIYRNTRKPENILPLAGVCGAVAAACGAADSFSYLPREWAGQSKKKTTVREAKTSPRARWIHGCLSSIELPVWEAAKYDDEVDAIGLGLFHLGRLPRWTKLGQTR